MALAIADAYDMTGDELDRLLDVSVAGAGRDWKPSLPV
jgi:hypothetical protein